MRTDRSTHCCLVLLAFIGCKTEIKIIPNEEESTEGDDSASAPPEVSSVSISPDPAYTDDTLTASAESLDSNGDDVELRYDWYVNGTLIGEASTPDGSRHFDKHDEIYVIVTPYDGTHVGEPAMSASLIISNSLPSAPEVVIGPMEPRDGLDDLLCAVSAEATDADGDDIAYSFTWDVDGVAFLEASTTAEAGDTVGVAFTADGETWTCDVTTSDGEAAGESGSASVIIGACLPGSEELCPARTCVEVLEGGSDETGVYWLDPDGDGLDSYEVWCDLDERDDGPREVSGGWTLVMVSSDDESEYWSWNNKDYWSDGTTFGSLDALGHDLKSRALVDLPFKDLLVVHAPSGVWAVYEDASDGTQSLGELVESTGATCYSEMGGFALTAGTLATTTDCSTLSGEAWCLCDTDVYVNPRDNNFGSCDGTDNHAWGLTWSARNNDACPLDDPGLSGSLGPSYPDSSGTYADWYEYEYYPSYGSAGDITAVGFGAALDLNTGEHGTGENHMKVYVR